MRYDKNMKATSSRGKTKAASPEGEAQPRLPNPPKADRWTALRLELESLAERLDVKIRYDARMTSAGGFCRVRGAAVIFVNSHLEESDQVVVLAQSLRTAGGREALDSMPLRPRARALLEELTAG